MNVNSHSNPELELEAARHEVLAENTAQAVWNSLSELFREEARFRSRWVWELLQNARDASPKNGVQVWLTLESDRVIFQHNGMPFNSKNIAHLIYHGSTKYEMPITGQKPIGQFGTGFLTTHLISKTVWVKGKMDDGVLFNFLLDRRGDNAVDLKKVMDESWNNFIASLKDGSDEESFTTQYEYPLDGAIVDTVEKDILNLIATAGYVLTFNPSIRTIHINRRGQPLVITKEKTVSLQKGAKRVRIDEYSSGRGLESRYVTMITEANISVAIDTKRIDGQWSVIAPSTPRIFKAFPLVATTDFCLPCVINSEEFVPRQDRDTLVFQPNRHGKNENMALMEAACDLAARMSMLAAQQGWNNAAALAKLNPLQHWDWVNVEWLRTQLTERFVDPLRSAEIIITADGGRISPAESTVPVAGSHELCCDLWDVVAGMRGDAERLPRREDACAWMETIHSWAMVLQKPIDDFDESLTLKLCEWVAQCLNITNLQSELYERTDAVAWLNGLYSLISRADCADLFESTAIILSQSGNFKTLSELYYDEGVDEDLKDIGERLGLLMTCH